jgi:fatty acid omega-hydroxylase
MYVCRFYYVSQRWKKNKLFPSRVTVRQKKNKQQKKTYPEMNGLIIAETNVIGSFLMLSGMAFLVPLGCTIFILGIYAIWCLKRYFWPQWDPKEPPRASFNWPLFGVVFKLLWNWNRLLELDVETHDKHGPTISFSISPNVNVISTRDPENVAYVLKNVDLFQKGKTMVSLFRPFLGYGIFAVNGDLWQFQRKKAIHMFKPRRLAQMEPIFEAHLEILRRQLDQAVTDGSPVNLQDLYMRFTMDSIGEIAFGMDLNTLEKPEQEFCRAFDWLQEETDRRGLNPLRKYLTFWKYRQALETVDRFVYGLIEKKRESKSEQQDDFLSNMMAMTDDDGNPLSDRFLRDIVLNFMIAGRDTTAILLTWMTYMLYTHRDVELKLLNEWKTNPYVEARNLRYTNAVIRETLRLFPSVPVNFKEAQLDGELPSGHQFSKGQEIKISAYTVHRCVEIWGPDAREFNPDRWLDKTARNISQHAGRYFPFHGGPRKCLGNRMAQREAAIVLSNLLPDYEFRPVVGQEIVYKKGLTMPMRHGYWVKVYHRFG